jgi:membrane-bound lytic murein transglycosylase D
MRDYFLIILFTSLILFSCAAKKEDPVTLPDQNISVESESGSELERVIAQAEKHLLDGKEALFLGDIDKGRYEFDKAIEIILNSGFDINREQDLKDTFERISNEIYALELSLIKNGGALTENPIEPSIIDEIEKIDLAREEEKLAGKEEPSLEGVSYDIPMTFNPAVQALLNIFQNERRNEIEGALVRSGRYLDMIKQIFAEEGLPEDLAYMPIVESAFKPNAYSRARAKGLWQFIAGTARNYGLTVNWWLDERSDPEKSTRAAAKHLKDLYNLFGDWYLAMAAYNAGENKILRATRRSKTRDFWRLARSRFIRRETKNFVPAILASIIIAKNPEWFGFYVEKEPPLFYDRVRIDSCTDLRVIAECAGVPLSRIIELNRELRRTTTPANTREYWIKIPEGTKEKFLSRFAAIPKDKRLIWRRHLVRRGESLSQIAKRYHTTVSAICQANKIDNRHLIREGKSLVIPMGPGSFLYPPTLDSEKAKRSYRTGERIIHQVRRGDTLYDIARKYRTNVHSIMVWNNLTPEKPIRPGERLVIWTGKIYRGRDKENRITYRVKKGDTLYDIARYFRVPLTKICEWNGLSKKSRIYPGDKLTIYTSN